MRTKLLSLLLVLLGSLTYVVAQDYTIRGFIYDKSNGEPMAFEKVRLLSATDSATVTGALTDVNGFFSIAGINKGKYILKIDNMAYNTITRNIEVKDAKGILDLKFELEKSASVKEFDEVNVSAEGKQKRNEVQVSTLKLDKKGLERIPSVGAENDIVGAFSVTPGVVTTGDQGGQLYVRGGTPIQNKILLDGMTIYNPFHSIGFFSIFETELVKNVDIYTGGFDAKYGGRISSVMDITYRDGNRKQFGGKVSASPFLAKAVFEGPLGKTTDSTNAAGSYIFSAKHSLLDYTSKSLYPAVNEGNGLPFNFTDLYGKITFNSDGGSKFSAFGFHNQDSVNYEIADLNWRSSGGGMNFLLVPSSSPIFIKGHINGSQYETSFTEIGTEPRNSKIGGFDLGFDFTYFLKNEGELNYGLNFNGFSTSFVTYNEAKRKIESTSFTTEIGTYFNYRLVKNRWVVQPSIRVQVYSSLGTISPEPRLGLKYNASEKLRLKFSGGRFSQNFTSASSDKDVVNLFNGLLSAPQNVQSTFVDQFQNERSVKNGIQYAWHAIGGFEYDLGKYITVNIEGYYKYFSQLSNINQNKLYEDLAQFAYIDDVYKKDFIIESGESYGVDLLLKYSKERLFLWGVYSYGYSTRWDGFIEYFPVFDRRHNINMVGSYIFGKKKDLELNIRWNLGSGLPFTPTAGFYQGENFSGGVTTDITTTNPSDVSTLLGTFNSQRLPAYHRLDVTVKKQFKFKNEDVLEIIASVTNVYDRNNIFYINRVTNKTIYQFPILPSMGISYKF
ncbi:MAG: TonB-dependent receptor [Bacteroidetes bacterium]|nr:MAG: TonB-dependent receptor [Bacteroidota bacterium]